MLKIYTQSNKNKKYVTENILYFLLISFFYFIYFYLIGGSSDNYSNSFIAFTRNDTFIYHYHAVELKNFVLNLFDYNFNENINLNLLFSLNVIFQSLSYLIYESLWFFLFINCILLTVILRLIITIYQSIYNDLNFLPKLIFLLILLFFPTFVHTTLILGKDNFFILFNLYIFHKLLNSHQSFRDSSLIIFFVILFAFLMRPLFSIFIFFLIFIIFLNSYFFEKKENILKNIRLIFPIFLLAGLITFLIFTLNNHNQLILQLTIDQIIGQSQLNSLIYNNYLGSNINNFLNKLYLTREQFFIYQYSIDSNTIIIDTYYHSHSIDVIFNLIISSFKSLFYPFITTIYDVSNLKTFLIYIESFIFSLLICILFIKKERLLIKFVILLSFALFYGVTLYALPNLGTFIRYKVTFLPLLLLFSYGELNLFLQKKSFDIQKILHKFLLTRKFKIYFFLILATASFLIRDFIFISKSILKSNQEYLIISLTLISFLFNIFNTVFIDLKNNKKNNIFYFLLIFAIGSFYLLQTNYNYYYEISFTNIVLIFLITFSSMINSIYVTKLIDSQKIFKFYILIIFINFIITIYALLNTITFYNALLLLLIHSISINLIFFKKENFITKKKHNQLFDLKIFLNQVLIMFIYLVTISISLELSTKNEISAYVIKTFYSLFFTIILFSRISLLSKNNTFVKFYESFIYSNYFFQVTFLLVSIIFILFFIIIKFCNLLNIYFLSSNYSICITVLLNFSILLNLIFQKNILYNQNSKIILIYNFFHLIILFFISINYISLISFDKFLLVNSAIYLILPLIISLLDKYLNNSITLIKIYLSTLVPIFILNVFFIYFT